MSSIQQRETDIKTMLANKTKMLQSLIGDKDKANKFSATSLQIALNKDLNGCTEESIINCLMGVAMLDLSPDKLVGQAYLIKYGQECTLQIGYKGWLTLFYRAGYEIRTFPVFECDIFDCSFDGWDLKYNFQPNLSDRDLGNFEWEYENLKGVLVVAKDLTTGEIKRDFVDQNVIEKMRLSSPNQRPGKYDKPDNPDTQRKKDKLPVGIWSAWYLDMCCKSAIKKFKNQLSIRDDVDTSISIADQLENHKKIDFEKTKKDGSIIEVKTIEQKQPIKSLNDIPLNKPNNFDILKEKAIKGGLDEDKAIRFLQSNRDKIDTLVNDNDAFQNALMNEVI